MDIKLSRQVLYLFFYFRVSYLVCNDLVFFDRGQFIHIKLPVKDHYQNIVCMFIVQS